MLFIFGFILFPSFASAQSCPEAPAGGYPAVTAESCAGPNKEFSESAAVGLTQCVETFANGNKVTYTSNSNSGPAFGITCRATDKDNKEITNPDGTPAAGATGGTNAGQEAVGLVKGTLADKMGDAIAWLLAPVALVILSIATFLLWISGVLFNWVIIRTVFEFGNYFGNSGGMLLAWSIMRDLGNIVLLFGFIFMGIATILNTHSMDEYSAKKALPRLIIFAILLNFSLFAAQAVIDVSNAFASTFAIQAGVDCSESGQGTEMENNCANQGISGKILSVTGMATPFTSDFISTQVDGMQTNPIQQVVMYVGTALFVTITAVVLLAGGIMLAIRAVTLIFLMITSPIGFAGMAVPQLQGLARKWWDALLSQSFFAPVYILLILVSVKVAGELSQGQPLVNAIASGNSNSMQMILVYVIAIGLMLASLIVSKKIGAMGAGFATNSASALAFGTLTRGTNLAVGGASYGVTRFQQRTGFGGKAGEVVVNRVTRPLSRANLDLRRMPGVSGALGAAGITAGAKPADHATFGDLKHQMDDVRSGKAGKELHKEYEQEKKTQNLEEHAHHENLTEEDRKHLVGLSTKELEALHGIQAGIAVLAKNLTPEQFENMMKSDKLSEAQKDKLAEGRFEDLRAAVNSSDASAIKSLVKGMTKKELEMLPASLLANDLLLQQLTDKQRDDLAGSDKRTADERRRVKESGGAERVRIMFENAGKGPGGAAAAIKGDDSGFGFDSLNREQITKLPKEVLTEAAIAQRLSPNVLMALQEEKGKFTPGDIEDIGKHIRAKGSGSAFDYITDKDSPGKIFWS